MQLLLYHLLVLHDVEQLRVRLHQRLIQRDSPLATEASGRSHRERQRARSDRGAAESQVNNVRAGRNISIPAVETYRIAYNVHARWNSSTSFLILLRLTDRVSFVIARRSGAAATAVATLRCRTGSMINQEAKQTLGVLLTCSHTYESRRDAKGLALRYCSRRFKTDA